MLGRADLAQSSTLARLRPATPELLALRPLQNSRLPFKASRSFCGYAVLPTSASDGRPSQVAAGAQEDDISPRTGAARRTVREQQADPSVRASGLSRLLGVSQPRLMSLVGRCPALFALTPEAMAATLGAVAELTGLQVVQVPQLVRADPELLLQPDRLKANMREMAQALGVRPSEVCVMGSREPAVLALDGRAVEVRLGALQRMMGLAPGQYDDLIAALLRNPGVLLVPEPETIEAQLQALEAAMEAVMGEGGEEEGEGSSTSSSSAVAPSPPPQPPPPPPPPHRVVVVRLVLSKPSLLSTTPQLLAGRLVHLANRAGVQPARVLSAAISGPDLLAASSTHIDRYCTSLAAALSHAGGCPGGEAEAAALLVSEPSLLGQSVGSLSAKWGLAAAVFRSCEGWERRLAAAAVSERAQLLAAPHARLVRLRFLSDVGMMDVEPFAALQLSDALFHLTHPGFRAWQQS